MFGVCLFELSACNNTLMFNTQEQSRDVHVLMIAMENLWTMSLFTIYITIFMSKSYGRVALSYSYLELQGLNNSTLCETIFSDVAYVKMYCNILLIQHLVKVILCNFHFPTLIF